ncbi:MAG: hypothetical protein RR107_02550 [Clostridia bacterium]
MSLIQISDEAVFVSNIAKRIKDVLDNHQIEIKCSAVKIGEWLVEKGYLFVKQNELGTNVKIPTQKGLDSGITIEKHVHGAKVYDVNMYPKEIQMLIVDNLNKIIAFKSK